MYLRAIQREHQAVPLHLDVALNLILIIYICAIIIIITQEFNSEKNEDV